MVITLGEASRQTGKSKTAITKAIKSGRLSATKGDTGDWQIDPAELFRVYPPTSEPVDRLTAEVNPNFSAETEGLRREVTLLRERVEELKEDRDHAREERDRLLKIVEEQAGAVRQLTDQRPKPKPELPAPPRKGIRGWLHRITA